MKYISLKIFEINVHENYRFDIILRNGLYRYTGIGRLESRAYYYSLLLIVSTLFSF